MGSVLDNLIARAVSASGHENGLRPISTRLGTGRSVGCITPVLQHPVRLVIKSRKVDEWTNYGPRRGDGFADGLTLQQAPVGVQIDIADGSALV